MRSKADLDLFDSRGASEGVFFMGDFRINPKKVILFICIMIVFAIRFYRFM